MHTRKLATSMHMNAERTPESRLFILGCGHPDFTPLRWGTSFMLQLSGECILVDCGPATTYKLYRAGIDPTAINHLFFTHYHSDHVADYPCFLMTRFDQSVGTEAELCVYGPPPLDEMTHKIWSSEGAFWLDVVARTQHPKSLDVYQARGGALPRSEPVVKVRELEKGSVIRDTAWQCTTFEVDHAQPYLACYGYRFESDSGVIAFSGDAAPNEMLLDLARGADMLVMAAMGFADLEQRLSGAEAAQQAGVKHLVISHQSPQVAAEEEAIVADLQSAYTGSLTWSVDLMEISW